MPYDLGLFSSLGLSSIGGCLHIIWVDSFLMLSAFLCHLYFWGCLNFCGNILGCFCFWGHLHSWGHFHFGGNLHFWWCFHFWVHLPFWGCLHFWGIHYFEAVFILRLFWFFFCGLHVFVFFTILWAVFWNFLIDLVRSVTLSSTI